MTSRGVKIAVASAAAGMAITIIGAGVLVHRVRKRRKERRRGHFLSNKRRQAIIDFLDVAAQGASVPHGGAVGEGLYRNYLKSSSDKRLLVLYAALKVGEFVRGHGIDPTQVTADQLEGAKERFNEAQEEGKNNREGMLSALLSHDIRELKPLLIIALGILALI